MKIRKVFKYLNTGIFPATVFFSCGNSFDEIMNELKRCGRYWSIGIVDEKNLIDKEETWGFGLKREIENKKTGKSVTCFYIIIRNFDHSDEHYIRLAHECLHICQFLLPDFLNRDKEIEAEAYLHSHLMRQCLAALKKQKGSK